MQDTQLASTISIANMVAAVANSIAAAVLVFLTTKYVKYTKIQATASLRQSEVAEAQARVAEAQAKTAEAQGLIASEQAQALRIENQRKRANSAMLAQTNILKAKQSVASWFGRTSGPSFPALPTTIEVTPTGFHASIADAAAVDHVAASYMSAAASCLDSAKTDLDVLRTLQSAEQPVWEAKMKAFHQLKLASEKLTEADTALRKALYVASEHGSPENDVTEVEPTDSL
jgi:hypothetical protein